MLLVTSFSVDLFPIRSLQLKLLVFLRYQTLMVFITRYDNRSCLWSQNICWKCTKRISSCNWGSSLLSSCSSYINRSVTLYNPQHSYIVITTFQPPLCAAELQVIFFYSHFLLPFPFVTITINHMIWCYYHFLISHFGVFLLVDHVKSVHCSSSWDWSWRRRHC